MRCSTLLLLALSSAGDVVQRRQLSRIRQSLVDLEAMAKELFESGRLLGELATLDAALVRAEQRLKNEVSNEGQELYFMARILRGTIHQQTLAMDDEAVHENTNAYTLSNPNFWDDYYGSVDAELFDWYGTWTTEIHWDDGATGSIGSVLRPFLRNDAQILMVGCGRSEMSQQMYREGFEQIVNIDISSRLLDSLRKRHSQEMPLMSWQWMNISSLSLMDGAMDVVLEKGTLDSLQDNVQLFKAAVKEMHRVLRRNSPAVPAGRLISITDTERLQELESLVPLTCQHFSGLVPEGKRLWLYVCERKPTSLLDNWKSWLRLEL